jgi:hypothetical protein
MEREEEGKWTQTTNKQASELGKGFLIVLNFRNDSQPEDRFKERGGKNRHRHGNKRANQFIQY